MILQIELASDVTTRNFFYQVAGYCLVGHAPDTRLTRALPLNLYNLFLY